MNSKYFMTAAIAATMTAMAAMAQPTWTVEAGGGVNTYTLKHWNYDAGAQLQTDLNVRADLNSLLSARIGFGWGKGEIDVTSWHESQFTANWADMPSTVNNPDGWKQQCKFDGVQWYGDLMLDVFGLSEDISRVRGFVYVGLGAYRNRSVEKLTTANGYDYQHAHGWYPRFGIHPVWQLTDALGVYLDASFQPATANRVGRQQENSSYKTTALAGIAYTLGGKTPVSTSRPLPLRWTVEADYGMNVYGVRDAEESEQHPSHQADLSVRADWGSWAAVRLGAGWNHGKVDVTAPGYSKFTDNLGSLKPTPWNQKLRFNSMEWHLDAMVNPLAGCCERFRGYLYAGFGFYRNMHKDVGQHLRATGWFPRFGIHPTVQLSDHVGIFVDASFQPTDAQRLGFIDYSGVGSSLKATTTAGVAYTF